MSDFIGKLYNTKHLNMISIKISRYKKQTLVGILIREGYVCLNLKNKSVYLFEMTDQR